MSGDPWTASDPQPGDFDVEIERLDPRYVDVHEGDPDAKLIILVGIEGDDVTRLERLSEARGKKPADIVIDLIRDADASRT
jgi:hypothetical protein